MERAEYNKMLQTVQEIEQQVGFQILKPDVHRDDDGRVTSSSYADSRGRTVFRQLHPFTDRVEFTVDQTAYQDIVCADFTK